MTPGRDAGTLTGPASSPAAAKRGTSAEQAEIERLRRQNEHLAADLARNKGGLEDHKKTHAFLQLLSENADHDPKSSR